MAKPDPRAHRHRAITDAPLWTEAVCADGAVILCDGVQVRISDVLARLNEAEQRDAGARSALRQALDHIFEGEAERGIAIALCELDGEDPNGLSSQGANHLLRHTWEHWLPRAQEALKNV